MRAMSKSAPSDVDDRYAALIRESIAAIRARSPELTPEQLFLAAARIAELRLADEGLRLSRSH